MRVCNSTPYLKSIESRFSVNLQIDKFKHFSYKAAQCLSLLQGLGHFTNSVRIKKGLLVQEEVRPRVDSWFIRQRWLPNRCATCVYMPSTYHNSSPNVLAVLLRSWFCWKSSSVDQLWIWGQARFKKTSVFLSLVLAVHCDGMWQLSASLLLVLHASNPDGYFCTLNQLFETCAGHPYLLSLCLGVSRCTLNISLVSEVGEPRKRIISAYSFLTLSLLWPLLHSFYLTPRQQFLYLFIIHLSWYAISPLSF